MARPVIGLQKTCHPERSAAESKDLPITENQLRSSGKKNVSFRAAKRRGIFPIAEKSRLHPALEQNATLPQPARPFDKLRVTDLI